MSVDLQTLQDNEAESDEIYDLLTKVSLYNLNLISF